MFWESSKDRLIEFLQGELARVRSELDTARAENAELASLSQEAVSLCVHMVALVPPVKLADAQAPPGPGRPRSMVEYLQKLTSNSYKRERSKGRNLVAEMPPPSAVQAVNANGR